MHNAAPTKIAQAWIMHNPGVIAIPKAKLAEPVEENFDSLSIQLTPEDLQKIYLVYLAPKGKISLVGW